MTTPTRADDPGNQDDDLVDIRVYHNTTGGFAPYQPGQPLTLVFRCTGRAGDPYDLCEELYDLFNDAGGSDPRTVSYYTGNRSLSVGDVIAIDGIFYAIDVAGAVRLQDEPDLTGGSAAGTVTLEAMQ